MSKIKALLPEDFTSDTTEPLYYPGEEEAELKAAFRQHELSHYTTEELFDEINRRTMEPLDKAVKLIQDFAKKYGEEEAPF